MSEPPVVLGRGGIPVSTCEPYWRDDPRCPTCHDWLHLSGRCPNNCQPVPGPPTKTHPKVWPKGVTHDTLYAEQEGRCAICHRHEREVWKLMEDHDHVTGQVRGLLCQRCNCMLGMACDSVENLQSGIEYKLKKR